MSDLQEIPIYTHSYNILEEIDLFPRFKLLIIIGDYELLVLKKKRVICLDSPTKTILFKKTHGAAMVVKKSKFN